MTVHQGPRKATRAHVVLESLHFAGGRASRLSWFRAAGAGHPLAGFDAVVSGLIRQGMVALDLEEYRITVDGLSWLGESPVQAVAAPLLAAGPRYVPPVRSLLADLAPRARSLRPGAFDYRDIPSRYGDERRQFQGGLAAAGDVKE